MAELPCALLDARDAAADSHRRQRLASANGHPPYPSYDPFEPHA